MSYRTPTKHDRRAVLFAVAELLVSFYDDSRVLRTDGQTDGRLYDRQDRAACSAVKGAQTLDISMN